MTDRPAWAASKTAGDVGEQLVARCMTALGLPVTSAPTVCNHDLIVNARVEVKTDRIAASTGKVAIEVSHRGHPSGLSTTGAHAWAIVIGPDVYLLPTSRLRGLIERLPDTPAGEAAMVRLLPLGTLQRNAHRLRLREGATA
jgi:hypothetical protein